MTTVPHFAVPFRLDPGTGAVATVEQDSFDDVAGCVEVVLGTRPGQRPLVPELGAPDLLFARDVPIGALVAVAGDWEPRAAVTLDSRPDQLDPLIQRVTVGIELQEATQWDS